MPADPPPAAPGIFRITPVVATVAVVVAVIGLVLMLRPVSTPTQDCGTAMGFILDGRSDVLVDRADPPTGVTAAEAEANNEAPCRTRVTDALKPGSVLFAVGFVVAIGATFAEAGARTWWWVRNRRRPDDRSGADAEAHPEPEVPAGH